MWPREGPFTYLGENEKLQLITKRSCLVLIVIDNILCPREFSSGRPSTMVICLIWSTELQLPYLKFLKIAPKGEMFSSRSYSWQVSELGSSILTSHLALFPTRLLLHEARDLKKGVEAQSVPSLTMKKQGLPLLQFSGKATRGVATEPGPLLWGKYLLLVTPASSFQKASVLPPSPS